MFCCRSAVLHQLAWFSWWASSAASKNFSNCSWVVGPEQNGPLLWVTFATFLCYLLLPRVEGTDLYSDANGLFCLAACGHPKASVNLCLITETLKVVSSRFL